MDLGVQVGADFVVAAGVAITKTKEVCDSARGQVVEELEVDGGVHSGETELELGVLASLRSVDHLAERG